MLAGHYAPALIAARMAPKAPLWGLLLAAQAVDVGFMILGLAGIEGAALSPTAPRLVVTAGVWTHSVPMTVVWSVGIGVLAGVLARDRIVGTAVGITVASHWLADLLVHTPDLPLGLSQEPAVGLSLWLYPPLGWALECVLLAGAAAWLGASLEEPARRRLGIVVAGLIGLQTLSEFAIPTPGSFAELAASALVLYAAVAGAGAWVDRAR